MKNGREFLEYLDGKKLYGDDFCQNKIDQWYKEEENAYYDLVSSNANTLNDSYGYSALFEYHGLRRIHLKSGMRILGIGSASGSEFVTLAEFAESIHILEPGSKFARSAIAGKPVFYVKPNSNGIMEFSDCEFDLVVCNSVLHHIPNVSTIIMEISRVLKQDGFAIFREPSQSMGDWRLKRPGLTLNERGIPENLLIEFITNNGLDIVYKKRCMFSAFIFLIKHFKLNGFWVIPKLVMFDSFVSNLPFWSKKYHALNMWQKIRPTALAIVARKI